MRPTLTLVVLAKNHQDMAAFQLEHVSGVVDELILLTNTPPGFGCTGAIGNHLLDHGRGEVVGLVHADAVFGAGAIEAFVLEAASGSVCGMVGRALSWEYVWCNDITEARDVSTLDACSLFMRRDIGARFDTSRFDGFHCCVEDFCLTAAALGIPTRVAPASGCNHLGTMWKTPDWMSDYHRYREVLAQKWASTDFRTT